MGFELAVGTGFGLRFDFNFFVLRTDMGIPLRNPYVTDDSNWLTGTGKPLKRSPYIALRSPESGQHCLCAKNCERGMKYVRLS